MRSARALVAFAAALVTGAAAVVACIDTDPIVYVAPTFDAAMPDAGPDADLRSACQRCMESPDEAGVPDDGGDGGAVDAGAPLGCSTLVAECNADPRCAATYVCATADGCFMRATYRDQIICGLPCAQEAGIVSTLDPVASLVLDVLKCGVLQCGDICVDGGVH